MELTLGIDVGGTSIKAALVASDGTVRTTKRVLTPRLDPTGSQTISAIAGLVDDFQHRRDFLGVGIAVPGIVNESSGTVVSAVNLGWTGLPMKLLVEAALGRSIAFVQDVRAGAYAEAALGASARATTSMFIPIGTGISMATVIHGSILASEGWAGEIGQVRVDQTADRVGVTPLTLENVASAAALARRLGCADAVEVAARVRAGDPTAGLVWADAVDAIAKALAWATAVIGPDIVVLGGGLAQSGELLLTPLRAAFAAELGSLRHPQVVRARFGDRSATVGAALLAQQHAGA
ncbi:ROK family protein [Salinibacterium sp.]|uniref:ROK family protein n=1 Tax=Salinibacterium sp. TaxID=1915057 RepID=UPI00286AC00D|nr:ROK family protein [Salinibacterium sp.]